MQEWDSIMICKALKVIWSNSSLQTLAKTKTNILENTQHFLRSIDRITSYDYVPSDRDILLCPVPHTGILEVKYHSVGTIIRLIDVDGENELSKLLPILEETPAIIFCVALNEYDMEDEHGENKMINALRYFEEVCKKPKFSDVSTILLLNKEDLFAEKLKKTNITNIFPEYKGGSLDKAIAHIKNQFQSVHPPSKAFYCHSMSAIDPDCSVSKFVRHVVKDIVLRKAIAISTIV